MKRTKRRMIALLLAVVLVGGGWAGLLAGWHSAQTLGRPVGRLPQLVLQADGGVKLTFGTQQRNLTQQQVRSAFFKMAWAESLLPRSLRITALWALATLFAVQQAQQPAAGERRLAGRFGAYKSQCIC